MYTRLLLFFFFFCTELSLVFEKKELVFHSDNELFLIECRVFGLAISFFSVRSVFQFILPIVEEP